MVGLFLSAFELIEAEYVGGELFQEDVDLFELVVDRVAVPVCYAD